MDRFRSLPIAKGSVLAVHAVANLLRGLIPIVLMSLAGLVVGCRTRTGPLEVAAGFGLMILFTFAMIWIGVLLGSLLATPEAVQGVAFVAIFPLTFVASTFVPSDTLPGVLRTVAEWNPISALAGSLRELFGNPGGIPASDAAWPLQHAIVYVLIWTVGIIVVCAPLAVIAYSARSTTRARSWRRRRLAPASASSARRRCRCGRDARARTSASGAPRRG